MFQGLSILLDALFYSMLMLLISWRRDLYYVMFTLISYLSANYLTIFSNLFCLAFYFLYASKRSWFILLILICCCILLFLSFFIYNSISSSLSSCNACCSLSCLDYCAIEYFLFFSSIRDWVMLNFDWRIFCLYFSFYFLIYFVICFRCCYKFFYSCCFWWRISWIRSYLVLSK